jgi:hypothetical protein
MAVSIRHDAKENIASSRQAQGMESLDGLPADTTTNAPSIPPSTEASQSHKSSDSPTQPAHQRLIFTDPVAFR